ncbi:MAG TPA: UvrD-helicase domain-containing protein, partial [Acidimicrobiales bacterium]|nr:UvrD-helicase domain-containing protein [Acidimicrobiales bacterium]
MTQLSFDLIGSADPADPADLANSANPADRANTADPADPADLIEAISAELSDEIVILESVDPIDEQPQASDAPARAEVLAGLDRSLFVEAGAGTGKTTALVGRVLALVTSGGVRLSRIAAITFTEAAAAELRDRVYEALEQAAVGNEEALVAEGLLDPLELGSLDSAELEQRRARAHAAVEEIDSAPISTLHGFAQRILAAHPFEAGLPPTFDVLDEGRSAVAFDDRWAAFVDELLDDASLAPALTRAFVCGIRVEQLRTAAEQFNQNWDLLVDDDNPEGSLNVIDAGPVIEQLDAAALACEQHCTADDDRLARHISGLGRFRQALGSASSDLEMLQLLVNSRPLTYHQGQKGNWVRPIGEVRDMLRSAETARTAVIEASALSALSYLIPAIRALTVRGAEERRSGGRLEFHDL